MYQINKKEKISKWVEGMKMIGEMIDNQDKEQDLEEEEVDVDLMMILM